MLPTANSQQPTINNQQPTTNTAYTYRVNQCLLISEVYFI
ncbi:hypothetical protein ADIWIN_0515 [Winogradskyella psychrotolerans RS-3]|uniref:Uncharacterized protein n=1 Tax=Winogradskyella psychrotolerans RS-3 TaxID=641526 RepID=S7X5T1_9FLAO|nr:hypothetical protein ADIWIN_0515 [Winogradskyella psychrotolerans RS-3]